VPPLSSVHKPNFTLNIEAACSFEQSMIKNRNKRIHNAQSTN